MSIRREPSHGYMNWTVIHCDHCGKFICDGNGWENAMERAPEEAVIIEEFDRGHMRRFEQFCDAECLSAYEENES